MRKKTKLFLLSLLLLTPAILYFALHEEYGNSYSEQQRKLVNTFIKDSNVFNSIDWNPKRQRLTYKDLMEKTTQLVDLYQPKWEAPLNIITPDFDQLPIEGLTTWELVKLGEKTNDPDIYLLLSEIRENTRYRFSKDNAAICYALRKKWLQKAIDFKRPGADFLLAAANASTKANTLPGESTDASYIMNIPGYDEFAKLVMDGDYRLFRALLSIEPYVFLTPLGSQFESQLKQLADSGNVEAQRQLGEIGFLFYQVLTDYALRLIENEIIERNSNINRNKFKSWLEEQEYATFYAGVTPSRKKMIQYARYLEQAAGAGDLQAMNLWILEGSRYFTEYGKKQWEAVFRYKDALIQAGYADFIRQALFLAANKFGVRASNYLLYFYGEKEMEHVRKHYFSHLFHRNDIIQCDLKQCEKFLSNEKPLPAEIVLPILETWRETHHDTFGLWAIIRRYGQQPDIKTLVLQILETNASNEHIDSILELAELYRIGQYVKKDLSKSLNYYEQAWGIIKNQKSINNLYGYTLFDFLRWLPQLFEFYLGTDSDFFDRDIATQFVHDFESWISLYHQLSPKFPDETKIGIILVEGVKYDQGLGVPQDHAKAQQIYNQILERVDYEKVLISFLKKINSCYKPQQNSQTL